MSSPQPSDVTTGELGRRLDELRGDVLRHTDKLDHVIANLITAADLQALGAAHQVGMDAMEQRIDAHQNAQDERLAKLERWNEWATRIVLGAVIVAVLGLVIAQGGAL